MKLDKANILITGGTGSFGKAYTRFLLEKYQPETITIFSRDEQKHYAMKHEFAQYSSQLRFVLGDLRDKDQVYKVMKGIDFVIHSAAMKHMPMAEENPMEAVKTNILGSNNLIEASIHHKVNKVVALSTDKASLPINVYGATKLILERLFISADSSSTNTDTRFSVVRYANVFGSKGSVIPLFLQLKESGELPITHPKMTRFSIKMQEGIELVQFALDQCVGGEIIIPIAPSYSVGDVAEAIGPDCKKIVIGPRNAEKMHEVLISEFEVSQTIKKDQFYIICPESGRQSKEDFIKHYNAENLSGLQEYNSGTNDSWMTVEEIRKQASQL